MGHLARVTLVLTLGLYVVTANTAALGDLEDGAQIQEFVIITDSLEQALPAYTDVLRWSVKADEALDRSTISRWQLDGSTSGRHVLVGNADSNYGYIRLVQLNDVEQQLIRPGGRWWDRGGMFNVNVLVKDLDRTQQGLRRLGWTANNLPEQYSYPGNVVGKSLIMVGHDDLVLSFQERTSPPLTGWPEFQGATHIEVGYQLVEDLDAWADFHTRVLGFEAPRGIRTRGKADSPVGPNDFGLPHNAENLHLSRLMTVALRKEGEQVLGGRDFTNATGYDFADRARPPNLGIALIRLAVADLDGISQRLQAQGIQPLAARKVVEMPPYGRVESLIVETPESGLWLELIRPSP